MSDSSTDSEGSDSEFSPSLEQKDASRLREALRKWSPGLRGAEKELTPGSAAVLRALSANGDLSWLTGVGDVPAMFRRLTRCLEAVRTDAQEEVRAEMDASLAEIRVALSETVEVSSQRNSQLEAAVEAAEAAFKERDNAKALLREANARLGEYSAKVEDLEMTVEEAIDSTAGLAELAGQLQESEELVERYRGALERAEGKLSQIARLDKAKDVRIGELEGEIEAIKEAKETALRSQRAEAAALKQRHEGETRSLRARLQNAESAVEEAKRMRVARQPQESGGWGRVEEAVVAVDEASVDDAEWRAEGVADSLAMFNVQQLRSQVGRMAGRGAEEVATVQADLARGLEQVAGCVASDARRLAAYEAQIDKLSTELMEARNHAIEMRSRLGSGGGDDSDHEREGDMSGSQSPDTLRRQVSSHKAKQERLMGQAVELEVLLEHRTKQLHAAEARANDLQIVARNMEKQNAELKQELTRLSEPVDIDGELSETADASPSSVTFLRRQLRQAAESLERLRLSAGAEVETLRAKIKEERQQREQQDSVYKQEVTSLRSELEVLQSRRDGSSAAVVADNVDEGSDDRPPSVVELRTQLNAASDANQELQETVRRLANDRQDLQAEVARLEERLRLVSDVSVRPKWESTLAERRPESRSVVRPDVLSGDDDGSSDGDDSDGESSGYLNRRKRRPADKTAREAPPEATTQRTARRAQAGNTSQYRPSEGPRLQHVRSSEAVLLASSTTRQPADENVDGGGGSLQQVAFAGPAAAPSAEYLMTESARQEGSLGHPLRASHSEIHERTSISTEVFDVQRRETQLEAGDEGQLGATQRFPQSDEQLGDHDRHQSLAARGETVVEHHGQSEQHAVQRVAIGDGSNDTRPCAARAPAAVMQRAAEFEGDEGLRRPATAAPSSRHGGPVGALAPADVTQRAAQFAGDEGLERPATAAPSSVRGRPIGGPAPAHVMQRAAEFAGDEGVQRPATAAPSTVRGRPIGAPASAEARQLAAEYAGDEGTQRPASAVPSSMRGQPLGAPAPLEVIQHAALFTSDEGAIRPHTAAPSRQRDPIVAPDEEEDKFSVHEMQIVNTAAEADGEAEDSFEEDETGVSLAHMSGSEANDSGPLEDEGGRMVWPPEGAEVTLMDDERGGEGRPVVEAHSESGKDDYNSEEDERQRNVASTLVAQGASRRPDRRGSGDEKSEYSEGWAAEEVVGGEGHRRRAGGEGLSDEGEDDEYNCGDDSLTDESATEGEGSDDGGGVSALRHASTSDAIQPPPTTRRHPSEPAGRWHASSEQLNEDEGLPYNHTSEGGESIGDDDDEEMLEVVVARADSGEGAITDDRQHRRRRGGAETLMEDDIDDDTTNSPEASEAGRRPQEATFADGHRRRGLEGLPDAALWSGRDEEVAQEGHRRRRRGGAEGQTDDNGSDNHEQQLLTVEGGGRRGREHASAAVKHGKTRGARGEEVRDRRAVESHSGLQRPTTAAMEASHRGGRRGRRESAEWRPSLGKETAAMRQGRRRRVGGVGLSDEELNGRRVSRAGDIEQRRLSREELRRGAEEGVAEKSKRGRRDRDEGTPLRGGRRRGGHVASRVPRVSDVAVGAETEAALGRAEASSGAVRRRRCGAEVEERQASPTDEAGWRGRQGSRGGGEGEEGSRAWVGAQQALLELELREYRMREEMAVMATTAGEQRTADEAMAAKEEARKAAIQRLEAERRDARAQERAIAAVELARSIDEEVVMRALRRAGLVQRELRRSMKLASDDPAALEGAKRRSSSGPGRRSKTGRKQPAAAAALESLQPPGGDRSNTTRLPGHGSSRDAGLAKSMGDVSLGGAVGDKRCGGASKHRRKSGGSGSRGPSPSARRNSAAAIAQAWLHERAASAERCRARAAGGAGRLMSLSAGRGRRGSRPSSPMHWRSSSVGRPQRISDADLHNPAGVFTAKGIPGSERWLWHRFNPTAPYQPHAFSSVFRSTVFDDTMRQKMVESNPRRRPKKPKKLR